MRDKKRRHRPFGFGWWRKWPVSVMDLCSEADINERKSLIGGVWPENERIFGAQNEKCIFKNEYTPYTNVCEYFPETAHCIIFMRIDCAKKFSTLGGLTAFEFDTRLNDYVFHIASKNDTCNFQFWKVFTSTYKEQCTRNRSRYTSQITRIEFINLSPICIFTQNE